MYNDAKKASNNKYLSKFKPISLRVLPAEAERITAAAAAAGLSVHAFIIDAVRARLDGPQGDGGELLPAGVLDMVKAAADRAGKDPAAWLLEAVQEQSARDARTEELRRLLANKERN